MVLDRGRPLDLQQLLEEAAALKGDLVSFALTPPFQRPLREYVRLCEHPALDGNSQMVEAIESLLFEYRYDDDSTVLDRYVARHPKLSEHCRALVRSWQDSVHGVFEISEAEGDRLVMTNLFDEMSYTAYANAGAESIQAVKAGSFLITRVVSIGAVWMLSGTQTVFPAEDRAAIAELVAKRCLQHPALVLRNPAKRRAAEDSAREMHESFLECFKTDLLVVSGPRLSQTYQGFLAFHAQRTTGDDAVSERLRRAVDTATYDKAFGSATTVAIEYRPDSGVWFYAEYGAVAEAFANPKLISRQPHRAAVRNYLEDDTIPPWVFQRLAEASPDRADKVFASVLARRNFRWEEDGDALLRQRKPSFFRDRPISPGIVPLPSIAAEQFAPVG